MRQVSITEARLDRLLGRTLEALVEAPVPGKEDPREYRARLRCQAPEVDGLTCIASDTRITLGTFVRGKLCARHGFDLELCLED